MTTTTSYLKRRPGGCNEPGVAEREHPKRRAAQEVCPHLPTAHSHLFASASPIAVANTAVPGGPARVRIISKRDFQRRHVSYDSYYSK